MTTDTAVRSDIPSSSPAMTRVVSYLRVSTGRQAESDLSIPDQRRQIERYCAARGWAIVEDYVEPGSSATDDRRPAFQQMIDAALVRPPAFSTILVHSFSRFFRDQFQFERYVRKLAKNGVQVISITQDLGDNPMGTMMRQIVTLAESHLGNERRQFIIISDGPAAARPIVLVADGGKSNRHLFPPSYSRGGETNVQRATHFTYAIAAAAR